MKLSRHRILIFLALSVLLHGLALLWEPAQDCLPAPASSGMQVVRIEMMRVPAVPAEVLQPAPVDKPSPPPEPQRAPAPAVPAPPAPEAPAKKTARLVPEAAPQPQAQPTPSAPPAATMTASLPPDEPHGMAPLNKSTQPQDAPSPSSVPAPALTSPAKEALRDNARVDALRQAYLLSLPPLIRPHQRYPLPALRAGREGTVIVRFVLERDGRLRESAILESSGDRLLDQAAAAAIERVGHFPAFPTELPEESLPIELPVRFDRSLR
ncbi:energy transducer TonB [Geoalkalibacter halelectricus]|uniref:Energy transducer TonB n=1 Tax=Geoalkalibacter halelectricus TaxID=2847045 RepID=A0ABY5ZLM2_9BACT|nr:energy transducer TonB [Geoalkalibacter halelectricus]MDO3378647.1 energy transducer TonB [Geoalkalibacter halelectricus]UWZ80041.1 energy transducer TonB [Geoalkalibacter halelectricus]